MTNKVSKCLLTLLALSLLFWAGAGCGGTPNRYVVSALELQPSDNGRALWVVERDSATGEVRSVVYCAEGIENLCVRDSVIGEVRGTIAPSVGESIRAHRAGAAER